MSDHSPEGTVGHCAECAAATSSLIEYAVPIGLWRGLTNYVVHRRLPGGFLQACLTNDFARAACNADADSRARLREIALWLYNAVPGECWGSRARVSAWVVPPPAAQA